MKKTGEIPQGIRSADLMGQVIRRWRKRRGWTQQRLAEEAGIRQETVSRVENGSSGTELNTVFRLCAALGVEMMISAKPNQE
ncbi:MAG: helix-turn-helix transcriptional regulator [Elusimicrobia bacterium]|nr:helix-turn-helix transcriptional regulator [Elusimicrobiota bacterium]